MAPLPTETFSDLATHLLSRAKAQGATEADVVVADGETFSVQVRLSAVDRLTKAREKRLGLRVFIGKRSASTSTSDFSRESLDKLVSDTCTLAKAVVEDKDSGLPSPDLMTQDIPHLDLYDSTKLDAETQIELARTAEDSALKVDPRITNSEGSDFDSSSGRILLGNSHGFLGEYQSSSFSIAVMPVAQEPESGGMQRDAWYSVSRKYSRLEESGVCRKRGGDPCLATIGCPKRPNQAGSRHIRSRNGRWVVGKFVQCHIGLFPLQGSVFFNGLSWHDPRSGVGDNH